MEERHDDAIPPGTPADRPRRAPSARAGGLHPVGVFFLLAGAFLPIMDFFITNVALPSIDASLHASASSLELVIAGYGVAYAALLVLGRPAGRPLRPPPPLPRVRSSASSLASAACGLAPTVGVLIAARIVQGATAALLVPQVLATFHHTLERERKARALALYGATSGIAAVVGQLVGGLLVSADIAGTSWRPIFLVNVPIGLVVLLVAARIVPDTRSHAPGRRRPARHRAVRRHPDRPAGPADRGPLAGLAVVDLAAARRSRSSSAPPPTVVEKRAERRGEVPLLPPSLLRLPSMSRGLAMVFAFSIGFGAFMFVFALTVQDGLHADALHGGLAILPMAVLFFAGSLVAPRLIGRFGRAALSAGARRPARRAGLAGGRPRRGTGRTSACGPWPCRSPWSAPDSRCCSPACSAACSPTCPPTWPASAAAC